MRLSISLMSLSSPDMTPIPIPDVDPGSADLFFTTVIADKKPVCTCVRMYVSVMHCSHDFRYYATHLRCII